MVNKKLSVSRSGSTRALLQKMKEIPETFDFEFVVDGESFPAHRAWVSAASPVFCKMLTGGMKESKERKIPIREVCSGTWKSVLDYIYFEPVEVDGTEALQLLECARRFQLNELETQAFKYLVSTIDCTNCCQMVVEANRLHFPKLKDSARNVLAKNFHSICTTMSIGLLDADTMESVIKRQDLQIRSELNVLHAVAKWLMVHGYVAELNRQEQITQNTGKEEESGLSHIVNRMTQHVAIDRFSESELKEAVRLCCALKLVKMYNICLQKLLGNAQVELEVDKNLSVYSRNGTQQQVKEKKCSRCHRKCGLNYENRYYCQYCGRYL